MISQILYHIFFLEYLASICIINNNNWYADIKNTRPHLYEKWGLENKFMATSWVAGYFLAFFTDFGSFLRHFLSLRTIAQDLRLWISLQLLWLYKGHSGYCFDISISWVCQGDLKANRSKMKVKGDYYQE